MRAVEPCGTMAAYQRHRRHGEPTCPACLAAKRRQNTERKGVRAGPQTPEHREIRNGLPEFRPYRYAGAGMDTLTWWLP